MLYYEFRGQVKYKTVRRYDKNVKAPNEDAWELFKKEEEKNMTLYQKLFTGMKGNEQAFYDQLLGDDLGVGDDNAKNLDAFGESLENGDMKDVEIIDGDEKVLEDEEDDEDEDDGKKKKKKKDKKKDKKRKKKKGKKGDDDEDEDDDDGKKKKKKKGKKDKDKKRDKKNKKKKSKRGGDESDDGDESDGGKKKKKKRRKGKK